MLLGEMVNYQNVNPKTSTFQNVNQCDTRRNGQFPKCQLQKSQLAKMVNSMLKNGQLPKNNLAKMSTSVKLGEMVNYQNVNLQKVKQYVTWRNGQLPKCQPQNINLPKCQPCETREMANYQKIKSQKSTGTVA
jgi:hypothetical protein